MPDSEIDVSDIPELDKAFFQNVRLRMPKNKVPVSLRLDSDVLDWFRQQGQGYQTRINAVLQAYIESHQH